DLREQLARHRGEGQGPAGRQVEAPVRPLRDQLEQSQGEQQEGHLQDELRPAAERARPAHHRIPRPRRASGGKKVKGRNATVKRTRYDTSRVSIAPSAKG